MFDSILLEATEALLRQQAEIKKLHGIIRWCETRLAGGRARELDAMLQELARREAQSALASAPGGGKPNHDPMRVSPFFVHSA